MRADLRLTIAQYADSGGAQTIARGQKIGHFEADVMDAAGGIFIEKRPDGRFFT